MRRGKHVSSLLALVLVVGAVMALTACGPMMPAPSSSPKYEGTTRPLYGATVYCKTNPESDQC